MWRNDVLFHNNIFVMENGSSLNKRNSIEWIKKLTHCRQSIAIYRRIVEWHFFRVLIEFPYFAIVESEFGAFVKNVLLWKHFLYVLFILNL